MNCVNKDCMYFGNSSQNGYCSSCYKLDCVKETGIEPKIEKIIRNQKCNLIGCNRRLKKLSFESTEPCICHNYYCNDHKTPENHACTYNFQKKQKNRLLKTLADANYPKLDKI